VAARRTKLLPVYQQKSYLGRHVKRESSDIKLGFFVRSLDWQQDICRKVVDRFDIIFWGLAVGAKKTSYVWEQFRS